MQTKTITNKLIVVTDQGHLKAYRVSRESYEASLAVDLIRETTFEDYLSHVTDHLSPQTHKHQLQHIAGIIDALSADEYFDGIYLAAPQTMLHGLIENLAPATRELVKESHAADLVKTPKGDLLHRFKIS